MSPDNDFPWVSTRPPAPPARPVPVAPARRTSIFVFLLFAVLFGIVAAQSALLYRLYLNSPAPIEARTVSARGDLAADEKATIELYERLRPSVVNVTSMANHRDPFSLNVEQVPEGTGSGFIWDEVGHVVTNYHVIRDSDAAVVTLADQSTWKATTVGVFPDKDIAVLHIDAPRNKLPPIPVGRSDDLLVGQKTFAIGNPFGLDQTLTTGIISAVGREIESVTKRPIKNVIQTDAAINPGNSGGPLLDSAGRLIGVNTAIISPSGTSAGIGFAIPVDEVKRVVPQLIKDGKISRAGLGIQLATDQLAKQLKQEGRKS